MSNVGTFLVYDINGKAAALEIISQHRLPPKRIPYGCHALKPAWQPASWFVVRPTDDKTAAEVA
jgi:hypothetical protein